jgi:hypothetical protein
LLDCKRVDGNPICNQGVVVISYNSQCLIICETYTGRVTGLVSTVSTTFSGLYVNKCFNNFYMITYVYFYVVDCS